MLHRFVAHRTPPSHLQMLVLDEADDMIMHFYDNLTDLKKKLNARKSAPPTPVLMFSASFECMEESHPEVVRARGFTDMMLDRASRPTVFIRVTTEDLRNDNVTHFVAKVRGHGARLAAPPAVVHVPFTVLPTAQLPEATSDEAAYAAKKRFLTEMYEMMTVGKTMIFLNVRGGGRWGAVGLLRW
jgi:hypothetical protein